jgi:hypothetical protein
MLPKATTPTITLTITSVSVIFILFNCDYEAMAFPPIISLYPSNNTVYAVSPATNPSTVVVVDGKTNTVKATIPLGHTGTFAAVHNCKSIAVERVSPRENTCECQSIAGIGCHLKRNNCEVGFAAICHCGIFNSCDCVRPPSMRGHVPLP